jgi:4-hydroxymandelate synthase
MTSTAQAALSLATVDYVTSDLPSATRMWAGQYGFTQHEPIADSSVLMASQNALVRLTAAEADHTSREWADRHGGGIRDLAFACGDPEAAYDYAVANGAKPVSGDDLRVTGFGTVTHTFVTRPSTPSASGRFSDIDHFAVCLEPGTIDEQVELYQQAFGFREIYAERTVVGDQAMISHVVSSADRTICFTLIEPDIGCSPGQIDGFLDRNVGPGVQHVALSTRNIVAGVRSLSRAGVSFLRTPAAYYQALAELYSPESHSMSELQETNVLVDEDEGGQLFQVFTTSVHPRDTFFMELIERRGAQTFGSRNIKALYEAVERTRALDSDTFRSPG